MKLTSKIVLFSLATLLFFELIARCAFYLYPGETYKKYITGKHLKTNGVGAKGDLYRGQPFKIAFMGASDLAGEELLYNYTITQKIKEILGTDTVHIDNFSINSISNQSILWQIKNLYRRGRHYNAVLITIQKTLRPFGNYFSSRWSETGLKNFFNRKLPSEPLLQLLADSSPINKTQKVKMLLDKAYRGELLSDSDYFVRLFPEIASKLANIDAKQVGHYKELMNLPLEREIKLMKKEATKIADKVFFIPSLVAYHPHALPSYQLIYSFVKPTFDFDEDRPRFYSSSAMFNIFKYRADKISSICKKYGIETMPYKEHLISVMPTISGLFIDEIHPTAKGATMASEYFARKLAPLLQKE